MTSNATPESTQAHQTRERRTLLWATLLVPLAVAVVAIAVSVTREPTTLEPGSSAPSFVLPATDGSMVSLSDVISGGDALLFFSMGAGCSGCFAQIPEIDSRLADRGIRLVPIMVDPPSVIDPQMARFGVETPILMDYDRSVSEAYDMLGIYGHADRPSHSFTLVGADGRTKWTRHFAEMFVPFDMLWAHLEDEVL